MKTIFSSFAILVVITSGAFSQNANLKVTSKESDNTYEFSAAFDKNKHKDVVSYMDKVIGKDNNFSFSNTELDSKVTLNDKSRFDIELSPGNLQIKFSKKENTEANYRKLKKMCEELSKIVHDKNKK